MHSPSAAKSTWENFMEDNGYQDNDLWNGGSVWKSLVVLSLTLDLGRIMSLNNGSHSQNIHLPYISCPHCAFLVEVVATTTNFSALQNIKKCVF